MRCSVLCAVAWVVLGCNLLAVAAKPSNGPTNTRGDEQALIVSPVPKQKMTYGMDFERLWHFGRGGGEVDLDELADWAVKKCPVDYVRIAINPAAELEEGQLHWEVYDQQLRMMSAIQRIRPDIKWFATPRPLHNELTDAPFTPFPLWVNIWSDPLTPERKFQRLDATKGADYYVRYLQFMNQKGFKITYLDAQQEATRFLKPEMIAPMIDQIRRRMGKQMPLVIAPSAWSWNAGTQWMQQAKKLGRSDFWDISAVHNTGDAGDLDEFVALSRAMGKHEIWNTELHGFNGAAVGEQKPPAEISSKVIFTHIRAGLSGLNDWLSLGNEKKTHKMFRNVRGQLIVMRPYYIWQALVLASQGGHYLDSNVPTGLESSMAFMDKTGTMLSVWVLNSSEDPIPALRLDLSRFQKPPQPMGAIIWDATTLDEGKKVKMGKISGPFIYPIAPRSLSVFSFRL